VNREERMVSSDPLRNRWWVVVACLVALIVNGGAVVIFTFAVFLKPISAELGWSRGALGGALALATASTAVMLPLIGRLIDRWGVQPVLLPGAVVFALATAAMSLLNGSAFVLFGLYAAFGLLAATTTPMGYSKAVASWFDKQRGLALGVAMAGVGLGTAIVPALAGRFIAAFGWRIAWVALAVFVFALSVPAVAAFVKEPLQADRANKLTLNRLLPGLTARQAAFGTRTFWSLTFAFLLTAGAVNGTLAHIVALLTDRGVPAEQATATLAAAGLAIIVGRVLAGYCMDRFNGPMTAAVFFTLPFLGILLLLGGGGGALPFVGSILCGLGVGAEVDLMGFFVSRYFGLRAFGEIYSYMFALVAIASGGGAALMGLVYDRAHSYAPMLIAFDAALGVSVILVARLGPYVYAAGAADALPIVPSLAPEAGL
jgi:MFS family permease